MTSVFESPRAGPMSGRGIIGDVTESIHRWIIDGYDITEQPPRLEEDLKFTPKDREEVVYVYMYRLAQNPNLMNQKRWRQAPIFMDSDPEDGAEIFFHRPPLLIDLFYLVSVHSKFRSDAERLLGWLLLRLHDATHLVYRPRKFKLPDGREVDSLGRPYSMDAPIDNENLFMEKVSVALVDDLTVGDAINLYSLHEAPYRPFVTYRARVAIDGALVASTGGTTVNMPRLERAQSRAEAEREVQASPSGRIRATGRPAPSTKTPPGPRPYNIRRTADTEPETED